MKEGSERGNEHVLEGILRPDASGAGERGQRMALVRAAEKQPQVLAGLKAFSSFLPAVVDPELADYYQFALLGVSVGFSERNLSSEDELHQEIIPPLLKDIRIVFQRLKHLKADYDPEQFRYQAYDYGIHKAYYLDWRLYLSKSLY